MSEYTPFIFITANKPVLLSEVYDYALELANNDFVYNIRISPSSLYELHIDDPDTTEANVNNDNNASRSSTDLRIANYDNFPSGTPYKGAGIKIGILDTGIFNPSHSNFSEITAEIVYDTYTANDSTAGNHPTKVASVLGGKFGYASASNLYYVDVNAENGYIGIERLINKGCHIINMSISNTQSAQTGEYDTGLEAYLDFTYKET